VVVGIAPHVVDGHRPGLIHYVDVTGLVPPGTVANGEA
jgi:hypothetical protein